MSKCEHGLTSKECYVCASPKHGKVIPFTGITKLDLDPDVILENNKGVFEGVVIMGWDKEGNEVFASSYADGGTVLWLAERMRKKLLEFADGGDDGQA